MARKSIPKASRVLQFDQIVVSDEVKLVNTLTREDVQTFAGLAVDFNLLPADIEFAQRMPFRRPAVHGMLSALTSKEFH